MKLNTLYQLKHSCNTTFCTRLWLTEEKNEIPNTQIAIKIPCSEKHGSTLKYIIRKQAFSELHFICLELCCPELYLQGSTECLLPPSPTVVQLNPHALQPLHCGGHVIGTCNMAYFWSPYH
jgi:hypothetical protein